MAKKLDINEAEEPFVSADEVAVVGVDVELDPLQHEVFITRLARLVEERFDEAERGRQSDEKRWLDGYHNYRGVYNKNVSFRENEKSKVFVKVTKTKVLAAYGQLVDVVFSGAKFPITIQETKIPEGIAGYAHLNPLKDQVGDQLSVGPELEGNLDYQPQDEITEDNLGNFNPTGVNPYDVGFEGDGNTLKPGAIQTDSDKFLGSLEEEYTNDEGEVVLEEGVAPSPEMPQINPAQIAARRMEKLIHDQIEESNGATELRNALFESVLLGTGIIKGPFNFNKTLHGWELDEETGERSYNPEHVRVPRIEFVSAWDFYPDPNATSMEEAEWAVHRHKLNRSQLRALTSRPYFDTAKISECLKQGYNYQKRSYEDEIQLDNNSNWDTNSNRFEVFEYWGVMDAEFVREAGLPVAEDIDDLEEIQINAWVCMGKILRLVMNPFKPMRIPYQAFPYEKNPYSFWGVGVPENMEDAQQIMNGHARMAIDNLALAGSLVFDVDEAALAAGQSMEIYPGKIFRRQAGMPGQSIYGLKFPNTAPENMAMFDRFRQLADEETGIPSYSHGHTGVQGMTRTASGMSMLMGASSLNIKTVVKNLDDFLLKPIGLAYYQWNMQFYEGDLNVVGDLEIKATGTSSLMQKEVRSQRLTMFLQTVQNPAVAPFVNIGKIIQELAYSLDLDPEEIINSQEEAAIYAEIIGLQNQAAAGPPTGQESPLGEGGGIPQGGAGEGATGNGNGTIGTGSVPQSGEVGFAGNVSPIAGAGATG